MRGGRRELSLVVNGELFEWYGPSPHYFVAVTGDGADALGEIAPAVSYGWGMIPVTVHIGRTTWTTSLFPQDGNFLVPIKAAVRQRESLNAGDLLSVALVVDLTHPRR